MPNRTHTPHGHTGVPPEAQDATQAWAQRAQAERRSQADGWADEGVRWEAVATDGGTSSAADGEVAAAAVVKSEAA